MRTIPLTDLIEQDVLIQRILVLPQSWSTRHEYRYDKRARPDSGLILAQCEGMVYESDGLCLRPRPGDILCLPQGARYTVRFERNDVRCLLVNFLLTAPDGEPLRLSDGIVRIAHATPELQELFGELWDTYRRTVGNKLALKSRLCTLLQRIVQQNLPDGHQSPVYRAVEHIHANLIRDFSVPELSRLCMMSESTFRREFRRHIGCPPVRYIHAERVKKAQSLLRADELSLQQIAAALGFYDAAHFCKVFKSITGQTPTQFRESGQWTGDG